MKKKEMLWSFATLVLALFSIWAVVSQARNYSFYDLKDFIASANPFWLTLALMCMFSYIVFEALAIKRILKAFGHKRKFNQCMVYSAADIYCSAITPSATGGQPASAYFMLSDGIPAAVSTVTLVLNLVMYTGAIMTLGIIAVLLQPTIFLHFSPFAKFLIVIGYIALGVLTVGFIMLLKRADVMHRILTGGLKLLRKFHLVKEKESHDKKLEKIMEDYRTCAGMIDGQRRMLVDAFVLNFFQRALQICVPALVFLASGGEDVRRGIDALDIWVTQAFVTIGSNCVPIPGAVGVSDYLLLNGLNEIMTSEAATNMELSSRGISFYCCLIVSLTIVAVGYVKRKKSQGR